MLPKSIETHDFINVHVRCFIVIFSQHIKWNSVIVYVLDRYHPQSVSGSLKFSMPSFSPLNSPNMIIHPINMLLNVFVKLSKCVWLGQEDKGCRAPLSQGNYIYAATDLSAPIDQTQVPSPLGSECTHNVRYHIISNLRNFLWPFWTFLPFHKVKRSKGHNLLTFFQKVAAIDW